MPASGDVSTTGIRDSERVRQVSGVSSDPLDGAAARSGAMTAVLNPRAHCHGSNANSVDKPVSKSQEVFDKAPQWQCVLCGTSKTPMKRNHPVHGPKTLCNACGVRLSRRVKAADKVKPNTKPAGDTNKATVAAKPQAYDKPVRTRLPTKHMLQSQAMLDTTDDMVERQDTFEPVQQGRQPPSPRTAKRRMSCGGDVSPTKLLRVGKQSNRPFSQPGTIQSGGSDYLFDVTHTLSLPSPSLVPTRPRSLPDNVAMSHTTPPSNSTPHHSHSYAPDADDAAWLASLNRTLFPSGQVSCRSPDHSSESDMTVTRMSTNGNTHKPVNVTPAQFTTTIVLLDRWSSSQPQGIKERDAERTLASAEGLPPWQVVQHIFRYWKAKYHALAPLPAWGGFDQPPPGGLVLRSRPASMDLDGDPMDGIPVCRSHDTMPNGVTAMDIDVFGVERRHSSGGDIEGPGGGQAKVTPRNVTHDPSHASTTIRSGKQRGELVGSCNFEVPAMTPWDVELLDESTEMHESLLGASLVVRKDEVAPVTASAPLMIRSTRSESKDDQISPPSPHLCSWDPPDLRQKCCMTYIVPDTLFDENWLDMRQRIASRGGQCVDPSRPCRPRSAEIPSTHTPPSPSPSLAKQGQQNPPDTFRSPSQYPPSQYGYTLPNSSIAPGVIHVPFSVASQMTGGGQAWQQMAHDHPAMSVIPSQQAPSAPAGPQYYLMSQGAMHGNVASLSGNASLPPLERVSAPASIVPQRPASTPVTPYSRGGVAYPDPFADDDSS